MKLSPLSIVAGLILGVLIAGLVQSQTSCGSLQAPTTQQADALVASSGAALTATRDELARLHAVAATQPSNADIAKQIANLEKNVLPVAQKAVDYSAAVSQAAYHDNPAPLIGILSGLGGPYAPLIGLGLGVAYGAWKGSQLKTAQGAVADVTTALNQYAQTVQAVVPDAYLHAVDHSVDSTTRAAVAATGVVKVPDSPVLVAPAVVPVQPNVVGTYPLPLRTFTGSTTAGL